MNTTVLRSTWTKPSCHRCPNVSVNFETIWSLLTFTNIWHTTLFKSLMGVMNILYYKLIYCYLRTVYIQHADMFVIFYICLPVVFFLTSLASVWFPTMLSVCGSQWTSLEASFRFCPLGEGVEREVGMMGRRQWYITIFMCTGHAMLSLASDFFCNCFKTASMLGNEDWSSTIAIMLLLEAEHVVKCSTKTCVDGMAFLWQLGHSTSNRELWFPPHNYPLLFEAGLSWHPRTQCWRSYTDGLPPFFQPK